MSTDHYVHCISCKSTEESSNEIRYYSVHALKLLIKHAAVIAKLEPMFEELDAENFELELKFYSLGRVDIKWFAKHAAHKLTIIDEYGKLLNTEEDA
jgi:hypothetical protein